MKILDKEVEFDFFDAEQMEIYEKEAELAKQELNKLDIMKMKQSEFIKSVCEIIEKCFKNVLEIDASKEIFNGKKNFRLCIKAFKDFAKARNEQTTSIEQEAKEFLKEVENINEEYKPNRATRRSQK